MATDERLMGMVVGLYSKVQNGIKVARRLGISPRRVYRLLRAGGVEVPGRHSEEVQRRKRKLHGERAEEAAKDYASGMSASNLEEKYGVGMWAIKTAVRQMGLPYRKHGGQHKVLSDSEREAAVRMYQDDRMSQDQIAAALGSSQAVIGRLLRKAGVVIRGRDRQPHNHGMWKGGRVKTSCGYVNVLVEDNDPMKVMADTQGYVLEHRLVMARAIGRPLHRHETVHHRNGNKTDNRLSNLQLRFGRHGKGIVLKCRVCGSSDIEAAEIAD